MPGPGRDERLDRIELPHHRRREDRRPRAVGQQEVGDRLVADVRGSIDAGFPVAKAPVDRRARHRRLLLDQLADAREVAVRGANGVLDEAGILLRKRVGAGDRVRQGGGACPHAFVASALMPSAESPEVTRKNERRDSDMN